MRMRRQGPDPEIFEQWCEGKEPPLRDADFDFRGFSNERRDLTSERIAEKFTNDVMEAAQRQTTPFRVVISAPDVPLPGLALDFSNTFKPSDLKADTVSHISQLALSSKTTVRIVGGVIHTLILQSDRPEIELEGCCIARLVAARNARARIVLRNTWIGRLSLEPSSVRAMELNGGSVRDIECPLPDDDNPFTGSASIAVDVDFPTSRRWRLLQGAQGYTNIRAHLGKLENVPAANLMRSLELRTEREQDSGFIKIVSWTYGAFANYGLSPGRPLTCAAFLYFAMFAVILCFDKGALGIPENLYSGWQVTLMGDDFWAVFRRSVFLPLQSMVNPLGLFGVRKFVVAATGWAHVLLTVQGLLTDALLFMVILGIRKRFKLP